jgi:hypothetical protein
MELRFSSKYLVGAAAMFTLGATAALGQVASTRRIPISKEAPAPRVDTVTVYKTDTMQVAGPTTYVHDTVRVSRTVHDTVTLIPKPMPLHLPGGWYFGVAGGASAPDGSLFLPNSTGWTAQGQVGYQGLKKFLGGRVDANYARPGEDSQFASTQGDAELWNFNADLKMQLPWFTHLFGQARRFAIYGLGGYTLTTFKDLPMRTDFGVIAGDPSWTSKSGWNLGGGASLGWGRTELFLETRQLSFDQSNAPTARQWPTVFGINFF